MDKHEEYSRAVADYRELAKKAQGLFEIVAAGRTALSHWWEASVSDGEVRLTTTELPPEYCGMISTNSWPSAETIVSVLKSYSEGRAKMRSLFRELPPEVLRGVVHPEGVIAQIERR